MQLYRFLAIFGVGILAIVVAGCSESTTVNQPEEPQPNLSNTLLPVQVGNYWVYETCYSSPGQASTGIDCGYVADVDDQDSLIRYKFNKSLNFQTPLTVTARGNAVFVGSTNLDSLDFHRQGSFEVSPGVHAESYLLLGWFSNNEETYVEFTRGIGVTAVGSCWFSVRSGDYRNFYAKLLRHHLEP